VRSGLRMEFWPAELARLAGTRASGRPDHDGQRAGDGRGQGGGAEEDADSARARPARWPAGASPTASRATPSRPSTRGDEPAVAARRRWAGTAASSSAGDRRDAHRAAGPADGGDHGDAHADQEPDQGGARLEDQRAGRQGDPNPRSRACSPSAASTPRPSPMTEETSPVRAASVSTERRPGGGWPRRSAAGPVPWSAARR